MSNFIIYHNPRCSKSRLTLELLNKEGINPEIVLIGTIAVAAGDLLLDPIRRTVLEMSMQRPGGIVKIMPAQLGQQIGDLAAISLVV